MYLRTLWHTADRPGTQSPALTSNVNEAFQSAANRRTWRTYVCYLLCCSARLFLCSVRPSHKHPHALSHYRTELKALHPRTRPTYRQPQLARQIGWIIFSQVDSFIQTQRGERSNSMTDSWQGPEQHKQGIRAVDTVEAAASHAVMRKSCSHLQK